MGGATDLGVEGFSLTLAGNRVFFQGISDAGAELWVTDGTPAGTSMVEDLCPGSCGSFPIFFTPVGNLVYFVADDGVHGFELWRTDGTASGTAEVSDICDGGCDSFPTNLTELDGGLLFFAYDGQDAGLWAVDAPDAGPRLVKTVWPTDDFGGSYGQFLATYAMHVQTANGFLFFVAMLSSSDPNVELWRSDGTTGGTVPMMYVDPGAGVGTAFNNLVLFWDRSSGTMVTDGTDAGTRSLDSVIDPLDGVQLGNTYFAWGYGGLWKTDGTPQGTVLAAPLAYYAPAFLTALGNVIYFIGNDPSSGLELWSYDGSARPAKLVKDIWPGSDGGIIVWDWITGINGGNIFLPLEPEGVLFFGADDGVTGDEPWRSNGQHSSTHRIVDLAPGAISSSPYPLEIQIGFSSNPRGWGWGPRSEHPVRLGGLVLFDANDGVHGPQLWTMRVVDIADDTRPALTCPPDQTITTSADGGVVGYPPATATDDNTPTPDLTYSVPAGSWFPMGVTPVFVTATDWGGNTSTCTFTVALVSASSPDAGSPDAGSPASDGGGSASSQPGCGCNSGTSGSLLFIPALVLLALLARSRRRGRDAILEWTCAPDTNDD